MESNTFTFNSYHALNQRVNFGLPQKDTTDNYTKYLKVLENVFKCVNHRRYLSGNPDDAHSYSHEIMTDYKQLFPLLAISYYNKIDLGELLTTQYEQSNLSLNRYISRSSLFQEVKENKTDSTSTNMVENILKNYLYSYTKYICSPIPPSIHEFPSNFVPFNDKIDITLQYLTKISQCINEHNLIKARPMQFDVYFVPPTAPNDLDCLNIDCMIKSSPGRRYHHQSGVHDLYPMFDSEQCRNLLNYTDSSQCDARLILLIVRKHQHKTNGDILYLFKQKIKYDLQRPEYENNEILWKMNTKNDIIPNKLNVDDREYNILSISYHLHSEICKKVFLYFDGYGHRVFKRDILDKWPLLFPNNKNKISNGVLREFNDQKNGFTDFIESDKKSLEIGESLFGLRYECERYRGWKRRMLTFPKSILSDGILKIREFNRSQQLYYYLAWTCKMQVIDGELIEYTLKDRQPRNIAIFNAELHDERTNEVLYVVALLNDKNGRNDRNKPKWKMNGFMTSSQIFNIYGIHILDLPIGSRYKHKYFDQQINDHNDKLHSNIHVNDWNRVPLVHSQQYKDGRPDFGDIDINQLIKQSIDNIRANNKNDGDDELTLIPILSVDTKKHRIYCDPLIPIKLPTESKWMAISYKTITTFPFKTVVTGLYIDPNDIINKAALVDPNAIYMYQWLKGDEDTNNDDNTPSLRSFPSDSSNATNLSLENNISDQSIIGNNIPTTSVSNQSSNISDESVIGNNLANTIFCNIPSNISNQNDNNNYYPTPSFINYGSDQSMKSTQNNNNSNNMSTPSLINWSSDQSTKSSQNPSSPQPQPDQSWIIQSLQQQLQDSLKREKMLVSMLQQKDEQIHGMINTAFPATPQLANISIPSTPISINNNFQIPSTPSNNIITPSPIATPTVSPIFQPFNNTFNGFNNIIYNNNHLISTSPSLSNNNCNIPDTISIQQHLPLIQQSAESNIIYENQFK